MFHCPKCYVELSVDARFCTTCGFNQTNARIAAIPRHQGSIQATSRAAQHWRTSWLARQRATGCPALYVSHGQASVTEPLLALRTSIVTTAIQDEVHHKRGFPLALLVLFCLLVLLCLAILFTYLPLS